MKGRFARVTIRGAYFNKVGKISEITGNTYRLTFSSADAISDFDFSNGVTFRDTEIEEISENKEAD